MNMFGSFPPSPLVGLRLQSLLGPGSRHCLWNHYTQNPSIGASKYFWRRGRDLEDDSAVVDSAARHCAENLAVAGDHTSVRAAAVLPFRELEIEAVQHGFRPCSFAARSEFSTNPCDI